MDMYTDETGFNCQEFLQDLKVGTIYHSLTFHIVVHCLDVDVIIPNQDHGYLCND